MSAPRVLTFNFHEPYLCLMARAGLPLHVGLFEKAPLARSWNTDFRPVPSNITFVAEAQWRRELMAGHYDVVVAHNEMNASTIFTAPVPKILVCHNRATFLRTTLPPEQQGVDNPFDQLLDRLREAFEFIYISETKRDDYGIPGKVIPPGIDVNQLGGYRGDIAKVLRVGNSMRERDLMFDVDFQEQVIQKLPNRVVGANPGIPEAQPSKSLDELLECYRSHRCYLHVTREAYEDGYNLAMLEAMGTGMPVVALANPTSPLTDGLDGFLSYASDVLHDRLELLLADPGEARKMGERARETVAAKFPVECFAETWREVIETAAERGRTPQNKPRTTEPVSSSETVSVPPLRVLLEYISSPTTTGRYFEWAARDKHDVVTAGFRCPEEVLQFWGFGDDIPEYTHHDVDLPLYFTREEIQRNLPEEWEPQVVLHIDSARKEPSHDAENWPVPTICYLIDTHLEPDIRVEIARHFDFVFLAQKAQVDYFRRCGIKQVEWVPLACSPALHDVGEQERVYDVAYIGRFGDDPTDRRRRLLERVAERYPNSKIGQCWPHEMAETYARSRIVVNAAINEDVNMRCFEAMASGALLITDPAVGLEDLFEDGKHLVIYRNDEQLFDLIDRYLADDEAREHIAQAGQKLVLCEHTYGKRIEAMLATVLEELGAFGGISGESRYHHGGYYGSERPEIVERIPVSARRILDVGCGAGVLGRALKRRGAEKVVGIEIVERACNEARKVLDEALCGNIEDMDLPWEDESFDCIVFGDVLEHLVDPRKVLRKVYRLLARDGVLLTSIPNVRYFEVVRMLCRGRWSYQDAGILDRTHLRFFTAYEMGKMFREAGYDILKMAPLSMELPENMPLDSHGYLDLGVARIGPLEPRDYQDFLTYQYVVFAGRPDVDRLARAREALEADDDRTAYLAAMEALAVDEFERHIIMARAAGRLGRLDEAEKYYRKAMELHPHDCENQGELGIVLVAANKLDEAESLLEKADEAGTTNPRIIGALGLVHMARGRNGAAYDALLRSIEITIHNESVLARLIDVAEHLGRTDEIEHYLRSFVEFYPGNIPMVLRHARLLALQGRNDEACQRLDTVLLLTPDNAEARALLNSLREP